MSVPEMVVLKAWQKAGGQCECARWSHSHPYLRCTRRLEWDKRGQAGSGGWAPRYRNSPTTEAPLACEILCMECHQKALAAELGGK